MKLSKPTSFLTMIYALLVFVLGIMGYTAAGSMISLIVGSGFGLLLIISSIAMFMEKKAGLYFALLFTFIVGISMATRFAQTNAFMPGAMSLFSGIVIVVLAIQIYRVRA